MRNMRKSFASGVSAILLGLASAAALACAAGSAAADEDASYTLWIWSQDDDDEKRVAVVRGDREQIAVADLTDRRSEARLLEDGAAEAALDAIEERYGADGVSLVELNKGASGGIDIDASDGDDTVVIRLGDGGVTIRTDDGDDSFSLDFSDRHDDDDDDEHVTVNKKRVMIRGDGDQDESLVVIRGAAAEDAGEFIDDLDDMPRSMKTEMKERAGLR